MSYGYLHRGRVIELDATTGGYFVEISTLAPARRMGPFPSLEPNLPEGQRVVLGSLSTSRDELVILGRVPGVPPTIAQIPGLQAALDGKADDAEITSLDARLDVVEPLVSSHTATLASHTSTLSSHTSTLASHTTTLGTHTTDLTSLGGRVSVVEAKVGYVLPVNGTANRPTTGLYDGYPIFRTDKGFLEFYDLANTKWRVRSMVPVGALADITDPINDQVVLLTTDKMLYRYNSGTWVGVQHTSTTDSGGARYRVASGHPSIGNGAITKLALATADTTTADVTRGGSNDQFTLNRSGWWHLGCRLVLAASSGGTTRWVWIAPTSDQSIRYVSSSIAAAGFTVTPGASDAIYLTSGTVLSMWCYQDSGISLAVDLTQGQSSFTAKWLGP